MVTAEKNGSALFQFDQQLPDRSSGIRIHSSCRFIENDRFGITDERPGREKISMDFQLKLNRRIYMATDSFLFIPPDSVDTVAFRFEVRPMSCNMLDQISTTDG